MSAIEVKNASNNEHPVARAMEFVKNVLAQGLDDSRTVVEEQHIHHPYVMNGVDMRLVIHKCSNRTVEVYAQSEADDTIIGLQSFSEQNIEDAYNCYARRLLAPDPAHIV